MLAVFALLCVLLLMAGCTKIKYVCSDGTIVEIEGTCPIEQQESYEKAQIQEVLDIICEGYLNKDENLILSTIDPRLTSWEEYSPEELLSGLYYPSRDFSSVEQCEMRITRAIFSSGTEKATVTIKMNFLALDQEGNTNGFEDKVITFFFIKVGGDWKTTLYDSMY